VSVLLVTSQPRDSLFETWLDIAVYAPLGLLLKVRSELPALVDTGRQTAENRVQVARFIGQMAVAYGKTEWHKRLAESRTTTSSSPPAPPAGTGRVLDATSVEVDDDVAAPFDGYDTLPASQIVARLNRMGMAELAAVVAYETAHRGRRTILAKAEQLSSRS
jgi:hypothetical protein